MSENRKKKETEHNIKKLYDNTKIKIANVFMLLAYCLLFWGGIKGDTMLH